MQRILLVLFCISLFVAKAQNGFTTYTTNLTITGSLKFQKALMLPLQIMQLHECFY